MRFQTLFKYRKNIMAAAIVMILLFHTKGAWPESMLKKAASFFYGGVDLFFFCSGVGCFFSYRRDRDPAAFLRRRAARILPVYLPFILVWILVQSLGDGIDFPAALANLLGVQGFLARRPAFNWYVSAMWLTYLLTPWFAALAGRCAARRAAVLAVLGLLLASVAFWGDNELIIIAARVPIFFVGMLFAAESLRRDVLTRGELALLLCLVPVGAAMIWETPRFFPGLEWSAGLSWYPMLLIAPGVCVGIAAVSEGLSRVPAGRAVNRAAGFLGGLTFEIYLAHFFALEQPPKYFIPLTVLYTAALCGVSRLIRKRLAKNGCLKT